jgi:hypothetical protein
MNAWREYGSTTIRTSAGAGRLSDSDSAQRAAWPSKNSEASVSSDFPRAPGSSRSFATSAGRSRNR